MFCAVALSMARRNRGFMDESPPPRRAATVISLMSRVKILPRLASVAAFLCLMFAHLLWPAMSVASCRRIAKRELYSSRNTSSGEGRHGAIDRARRNVAHLLPAMLLAV